MKISHFFNLGINPATAYILGLCFPKTKIISIEGNTNKFILGSVNHNVNQITDGELNAHFISVSNLFNAYIQPEDKGLIQYNNSPKYGRIQPKKGFSIVMEIDKPDYAERLFNMVKQVVSEPDEIKSFFVRGCFDGRSSFDTSRYYLSVDVDRDYIRQDLIDSIIHSLDRNIHTNINRREKDHPKNDQIRIKKESLKLYCDKVGFYSICRRNIVEKYI